MTDCPFPTISSANQEIVMTSSNDPKRVLFIG